MYDENVNKINWKDLFIKVAIAAVIILLLLWLIPKFTGNNNNLAVFEDRLFAENIQTMRNAAVSYYTADRMPKNIDDSTSMTLGEMVNNKLIIPFTDKDGKACDSQNSYVQVTKTKDNEYSLKVYLSCSGQTDYILDTIGCDGTCIAGNCKDLAKEVAKEICESGCINKTTTTEKKTTTTEKKETVTTYYNVSFNSNGGNYTPGIQKIEKGRKATEPSNPTRANCTFLGWYYGNTKFDFNTTINQNYTLLAHWNCSTSVKEYNVTFNSDGGNYTPNAQNNIQEGRYATKPNPDPTNANCTFLGWYYGNTLFNFNTAIYQNYNLIARWSCAYRVTFNSDGGNYTPATQTIEAGRYSTRPTNPTKQNCTFVNWYDGNNVFSFSTAINRNYTLIARWNCTTTYTYRLYQYAPYVEEIKTETFRSITYSTVQNYNALKNTSGIYSYTYEIQLRTIPSNAVVRLTTGASIMTSSSDFQAYINNRNDSYMFMTGNNNTANYYTSNESTYRYNSLTNNNMSVTTSNPFYSGGYWRITVYVKVNNINNVTTVPFSGSNIFFMPIKFGLTYTYNTSSVDMSKAYWSVNANSPTGYKYITYKDVSI